MAILTSWCQFQRVSNAVATGQTDVNSSSIDMVGQFQGVTFICCVGSIDATGTVSMKVQQSDDDGSSDDWSDIAGSANAVSADTDDNRVLVSHIETPRKRYLRAVVERGTADSVVDAILAICSGSDTSEPTQGSTIEGSEVHVFPAEGTA